MNRRLTFYFWLINLLYVLRINVMIFFQVSLSFDPEKEMLKMSDKMLKMLKTSHKSDDVRFTFS